MKKLIPWLIALLVIGAGVFVYWKFFYSNKAPPVEYKTVTVDKRKIIGKITASGTLQATVTVQVGTQVSGRVAKLNADFNSAVKKGELVAKIDPQLFQAAVAQAHANYVSARAGVVKADAQAKDAEMQYNRTKALFDQTLASAADLQTAQTNLLVARASVDVAKASVEQAAASLNQAQVNLNYTNIYSPIDGVVISRNVDVGQTVAASLSAPVLFTIAEDLRKMQVNTNIAEGDVGRLQADMPVYFTVDAFPGQRFRGKISQIRNAAQTLQNVVTYDAVIDFDNADLKLRPGMTANVTVTYAQKDDVIAVPNSALRFRPPPEVIGSASAAGGGSAAASGSAAAGSASAAPNPSASAGGGRRGGGGGGRPGKQDATADTTRPVWVLRNGQASSVTIKLGLSDGTYTEVIEGDIKEGDTVITDATVTAKSTTTVAPTATATMRRMF
jgi:HlyD family secretion protein